VLNCTLLNIIVMNKKDNRGGIRINAGAKPKYSEPTKTIAFRCPVSKINEIKLVVKNQLEKWEVKNELSS